MDDQDRERITEELATHVEVALNEFARLRRPDDDGSGFVLTKWCVVAEGVRMDSGEVDDRVHETIVPMLQPVWDSKGMLAHGMDIVSMEGDYDDDD